MNMKFYDLLNARKPRRFKAYEFVILIDDLNLYLEDAEVYRWTYLNDENEEDFCDPVKVETITVNEVPEDALTKFNGAFFIREANMESRRILSMSGIDKDKYNSLLTDSITFVSERAYLSEDGTHLDHYVVKFKNIYNCYSELYKFYSTELDSDDTAELHIDIKGTVKLKKEKSLINTIKNKVADSKNEKDKILITSNAEVYSDFKRDGFLPYKYYKSLLCKDQKEVIDIFYNGGGIFFNEILFLDRSIEESVSSIHFTNCYEAFTNLMEVYYQVEGEEREKIVNATSKCIESIYKSCRSVAEVANEVDRQLFLKILEKDRYSQMYGVEVQPNRIADEYYEKLAAITSLYDDLSKMSVISQQSTKNRASVSENVRGFLEADKEDIGNGSPEKSEDLY